jgi:hypothetical protein
MSTHFTYDSLKKLFCIYRGWGVERIYWIYTWKHSERLWEHVPNRDISYNYAITRRHLGEFLPAAVEIAHHLGMELYAVYKPFDMAFDETLPFGSSYAHKFGRMDDLSGRVYWATESIVRLQQYRIQRRLEEREEYIKSDKIATIVLRSNSGKAFKFNPKLLSIFVSKDNNIYRRYRRKLACRKIVDNEGCTIYLENLNIAEPYFVLQTPQNARRELFTNYLNGLVELFNENGQKIPFTYGLFSRDERYRGWKVAGKALWNALTGNGYIFDWHNGAKIGFLRKERYAIDNSKGFLAIAKGKKHYVIGALSPAYPQVQKLWLQDIEECLKAGVDGVDIRVANHNRSLEWENYGFEKPVYEKFIQQYGRKPSARDWKKCHIILGEFYTEFIQQASNLIRRHGKNVQLHIGRCEIMNDSFPIAFQWKRWLEDGMADEITLITDYPSQFYGRIAPVAKRSHIPMYFRKYIRGVVFRKRWQDMLRRYLRQSRTLGQAGFILYESSFVVHGNKDGTFNILYEHLPHILNKKTYHRKVTV